MEFVRIVLLFIAIVLGLVVLILIYNIVIEPFAYEIDVSGKGKLGTIEGRFSFRSLLRFLRVNVGFENKALFYNGSIFWGKLVLFSSDADNKKRKDKKENNEANQDSEDSNTDSVSSVDSSNTSDRPASGDEAQKPDSGGPEVHSDTRPEEEGTDEQVVDVPENGFEDDIFEGDEFKEFDPMKVKLTEKTPENKNILRTLSKIKNANLNYKYIIKKIKRIFHAIRIKYFEADCDYSLGAPDTTGKAVGVMSMLPFMYGKKVDMRPDFLSDDVLLDGVIKLKGNFRIISLICPALAIVFEIWRKTRSKK